DETEREPFYHAVETAETYAQICGASLVLGSATPRVSQYYQTQKGGWTLMELPRRVLAHRDTLQQQAASLHINLPTPPSSESLLTLELPPVEVVDMRQELTRGNTSVLSRSLYTSLERVLDAGQQAILFLNRKGSATYVFCRECGAPLLCPRDESPLVYHSDRMGLLCHICGYTRKLPTKCPKCGRKNIRQMGIGTEKLEALVKSSFPNARLLRWDAETTTTKDAHELILSHFSAHRADILIGTQMLAKGLDLPLVTLVGIILAEVGLNLPDYRAPERTFQVLTQVAGRAGRSPLGGKVILQTYQPDNYVIQAASRHDFEGFYAMELAQRRHLAYPPFTRLIRLEYRHSSNAACETEARQLAEILKTEIIGLGMRQTDFIGPVPCYTRRLGGQYRWQIILRGPDPLPILAGLPLRDWIVEVDPPNLL
ncbi:MAG: primosomal protein N', partial [Anaerolineaceae bacterium]